MKKMLLLAGVFALLLSIGLSGCIENIVGGSEEDKFVGTWRWSQSYSFILISFYSDGTYSLSGSIDVPSGSGTWYLSGGRLYIDPSGATSYSYFNYAFSNSDDTLELVDASTGRVFGIFNRQ